MSLTVCINSEASDLDDFRMNAQSGGHTHTHISATVVSPAGADWYYKS